MLALSGKPLILLQKFLTTLLAASHPVIDSARLIRQSLAPCHRQRLLALSGEPLTLLQSNLASSGKPSTLLPSVLPCLVRQASHHRQSLLVSPGKPCTMHHAQVSACLSGLQSCTAMPQPRRHHDSLCTLSSATSLKPWYRSALASKMSHKNALQSNLASSSQPHTLLSA